MPNIILGAGVNIIKWTEHPYQLGTNMAPSKENPTPVKFPLNRKS